MMLRLFCLLLVLITTNNYYSITSKNVETSVLFVDAFRSPVIKSSVNISGSRNRIGSNNNKRYNTILSPFSNLLSLSEDDLVITAPARRRRHISQLESLLVDDNDDGGNNNEDDDDKGEKKNNNADVDALLILLQNIPSNVPTSKSLTDEILDAVRIVEENGGCPTANDDVLIELEGNWDLLWTAQDKDRASSVKVSGLFGNFINPLENQSHSNNPLEGGQQRNNKGKGRANPILPREIQDVLERIGILETSTTTNAAAASPPIRSSQLIDSKNKRVRNVVNVQLKKPIKVNGSIVVDVKFTPNQKDKRRIDVKFESCRFIFKNKLRNINWNFPLGPLGPTGWLRTGYIDDQIRITRGHKGSVFILSRTTTKKVKRQ